ncbi:MAG: reverse gyrase [Fervidicoccaceae archaeon]
MRGGAASSKWPSVGYTNACPNCGGHIEGSRLLRGLPCSRCLPTSEVLEPLSSREVLEVLHANGRLYMLGRLYELETELEKFEEFFERAVGSPPWSSQKTWAGRVLRGKSFSIVAPTGVGKTVFGLVISLFLASKGKRSYVVFPTSILVQRAELKLSELSSRVCPGARVLALHSRLDHSERERRLARLSSRDFDVLVTTSRFMINRSRELAELGFSLIFVDDVDAVLRSGKSVSALLTVLGFTDEDVERARRAASLRRILASITRRASAARESFDEIEALARELRSIEEALSAKRSRAPSLVVSSATGRARGPKVEIFRELLGFRVGAIGEMLRRVYDVKCSLEPGENIVEAVARVVSALGSGGLVYVPPDLGPGAYEAVAGALMERGVRAEVMRSRSVRALELFVSGEIDVLVGSAVYYGVLVRGLDMPERVRYAVFAGVPRFKFSVAAKEAHPLGVLRMLAVLTEAAPEPWNKSAMEHLVKLRRLVRRLSPAALQALAERVRAGGEMGEPERLVLQAVDFVGRALAEEKVLEALRTSPDVVVRFEDGQLYVLLPDVMTYIQASGRTSRLYVGGLTRGLSVVLVDDERLMRALMSRLRFFVEDSEWRDFAEIVRSGELSRILAEIDEDRRAVRRAIAGDLRGRVEDLTKTVLLVVESPTKAKTISRFFGRPSGRRIGESLTAYEVSLGGTQLLVAPTGGHIVDLVTEEPEGAAEAFSYSFFYHGVGVRKTDGLLKDFEPIYAPIKRCRVCGHQFVERLARCPRCGSSLIVDSWKIVEALRELAIEADEVLIGTDPDTEGEKIGWDVALLLAPFARSIKRVEFHEVTKRAVLEALSNTREVSASLVEAQLVRRIEDRWIGFTLSPILWRVFWPEFCSRYPTYCERYCARRAENEECLRENRGLSAGRVQTPVLGWIVDRYLRSRSRRKTFYRVRLEGWPVDIEFDEDEIKRRVSLDELREAKVTVRSVEEFLEDVAPPPPFTTDSMLSEASRRLRLAAPRLMRLAQDLFELGLITYHRTDSTRVSTTGIAVARRYLEEKFEPERLAELFVPRTWGEEGAHEAIRPTKPIDADALRSMLSSGELELPRPLTREHLALYDLIFRRFVASQMRGARVVFRVYELAFPEGGAILRRFCASIVEGREALEIYQSVKCVGDLPVGTLRVIEASSWTAGAEPLFTQADVVELMKRRGIGRPSTYATIIEKLLSRRYVIERSGKLIATRLGAEVYKFLQENYGFMVSEERTELLEKKMDLVASGKEDYIGVLLELYHETSQIAESHSVAG